MTATPGTTVASEYERVKYDATLSACGPGPFESALELGGSIGVFSARLAERCETLTTIDFSPTAVAAAREQLGRLAPRPRDRRRDPGAIAAGRHDLVVASEILYYLDDDALRETLERAPRAADRRWADGRGALATAGTRAPADRGRRARAAAGTAMAARDLRSQHPDYLLDVLERP